MTARLAIFGDQLQVRATGGREPDWTAGAPLAGLRLSRPALVEVLRLHAGRHSGGRRANLRGADLRLANLREANLWEANLWGADLWEADLWGAELDATVRAGHSGGHSWTVVPGGTPGDPWLTYGCERHPLSWWRQQGPELSVRHGHPAEHWRQGPMVAIAAAERVAAQEVRA